MSKIRNITALRDFALETLEKLANKEIDCAEAGVSGKLCESVISTVKAQLEYSRMIGEEPEIPFMTGSASGRLLEGNAPKHRLPLPKGDK